MSAGLVSKVLTVVVGDPGSLVLWFLVFEDPFLCARTSRSPTLVAEPHEKGATQSESVQLTCFILA